MKLTFLVLFLFVGQIYAQPPECTASSPNALVVQGQPDFTSTTAGFTTTAISQPGDIAFHPTTGELYLLDTLNNRVMIFPVAALTTSTQSESGEFGVFAISPITAGTLFHPEGITISGLNDAWVADTQNSRVLRYSGVSTATTQADQVLGQADFGSNLTPFPPTSASMSKPNGVFADDFGNVWVADTSNHRVMQFLAASISGGGLKPNGIAADYIYGDAATYSNALPNTLASPIGVYVDFKNILWITDSQLDRVVGYQSPLLNNGVVTTPIGANYVLGQTSLTAAALNLVSASNINGPTGVTRNPNTGAIYIADGGNNRVVGITNYAETNGTAFDILIGYGTGVKDFTVSFAFTGTNVGANTLNIGGIPGLIEFDNKTSQALWVADSSNNRVLRYCIDITGTPSASFSGSHTSTKSLSTTISNSPSTSTSLSGTGSGTASISLSLSNTKTPPNSPTASVTGSILGTQSNTGSVSITQSATKAPLPATGSIKCQSDCLNGRIGQICKNIGGTPTQTGNTFTCANTSTNWVFSWRLAGNSCSQTGKLKFVNLCKALGGRLGCKVPNNGAASFTRRSCTYP